MPLMAFGVHNTIVKFYSSFKTRIGEWLSKKNPIIKDYTWLIYISAIAFAYFEIFYAWSKVQMQTVFGNFMKEVFHRACITLLMIGLYFNYLTVNQLIYSIVGVYILRLIIMKLYAYSLKMPVLKFTRIPEMSSVLKYTALIIIAGSVANIILEIDKFMIAKFEIINNVAYYGVAVYIATVIGVPARSMHQITNPLTAKFLNNKDKKSLKSLYQKSSINLFIISGFIFLLILINMNALYKLIPENYQGGLLVVFVIGLAKLACF